MPFGYPVMLELAGRRCVVIGAGAVREGKVEGLLVAGADDVLVVARRPGTTPATSGGGHGVTVERRDVAGRGPQRRVRVRRGEPRRRRARRDRP